MHTLLIVDDHESVLRTLEFVLASSTLRVLVSNSAAAGIDLAKHERVDAAQIDLHMPGMDGLTLCDRLREYAREQNPTLPVWIMTAAGTAAAVEQARTHGAVALLKKPFDCAEFHQTLTRHLESVPSIPLSPLAENNGQFAA